jgi:hypothetical protein
MSQCIVAKRYTYYLNRGSTLSYVPDYIIIKQTGPKIGLKKIFLKGQIMKTSYVDIIINPAATNGKAMRVAQTLLQKIKSTCDFENAPEG